MLSRRETLRGGTAAVVAIAAAGAVAVPAIVHEPVLPLVDKLKSVDKVWFATVDAFDEAVSKLAKKIGRQYSFKLDPDHDAIAVQTDDFQAYWSGSEIEDVTRHGHLTAEERDHWLAELEAERAEKIRILREHGLDRLAEEKQAYRQEYFELRQQILDTPASTVEGVLAKIRAFYSSEEEEAVLTGEELWDDLDAEFSASIYLDLLRLAGEV